MNKSTKKKPTSPRKTKAKPIKSDALVKKILSEKIAAQEFLSEYLPDNFKAQLDLNTVQVTKESFVEEELRRQLSDIVYDIKTKDDDHAFVYILLESQSSVDQIIAFRLWKYTLLLLERHIKDNKKLPLVMPMVLYHGKHKYTAARSLWDLFSDPKTAKQLMQNEYKLIDLQAMPDDEIRKKQHLGMLEFFLKNIHMRDMIKLWEQFFNSFRDVILLDGENGFIYLKSFLYYTDTKVGSDKKDELTRLLLTNLPKEEGEKLMYTIADSYIDQGIEKGIIIGKAEGVQQSKIEIAKKMLTQDYALTDISDLTGLSISDIKNLQA